MGVVPVEAAVVVVEEALSSFDDDEVADSRLSAALFAGMCEARWETRANHDPLCCCAGCPYASVKVCCMEGHSVCNPLTIEWISCLPAVATGGCGSMAPSCTIRQASSRPLQRS